MAVNYARADFRIYQERNGDYRWRIVSSNGRIVGASTEGYRNRQDCIDNVKNLELYIEALRNAGQIA